MQLHSLSYFKANGRLEANSTTAYFNTQSGMAEFSNLVLTDAGMYILTFSISSSDNSFVFNCYSKTIMIVNELSQATYSPNVPPNYIFKFDGDYSAIDVDNAKSNIFNFALKYGVVLAGLEAYSGSVYISGHSSTASSNMSSLLASSGVVIDPNMRFTYISVNDVLINCTNCAIVVQTPATSSVGDEEVRNFPFTFVFI